jgi:hypothetical protein
VSSAYGGFWGKAIVIPDLGRLAIHVPGLGSLNVGNSHVGKSASVDSLSCAAPGDCSAGGYYAGSGFAQQAFVVTEHRGVWGRAIVVPGSAALNVGGDAEIDTVSCAAPGDCGAGGYCSYGKTGLDSQGFVDPNNGDIALSFVQ